MGPNEGNIWLTTVNTTVSYRRSSHQFIGSTANCDSHIGTPVVSTANNDWWQGRLHPTPHKPQSSASLANRHSNARKTDSRLPTRWRSYATVKPRSSEGRGCRFAPSELEFDFVLGRSDPTAEAENRSANIVQRDRCEPGISSPRHFSVGRNGHQPLPESVDAILNPIL